MARCASRPGRWPRPTRRSRSISPAGRASKRRSRRSPTTSPTTITISTTGCGRAVRPGRVARGAARRAPLGGDRGRAIPGSSRTRSWALVRDLIGTMVGDVLAETRRRIAEAGSSRSTRCAPRAARWSAFPMRWRRRSASLSATSMPTSTTAKPEADPHGGAAHRRRPRAPTAPIRELPPAGSAATDETARLRGIGDFIAGMTDRFAIARHEELIGPVNLPDRF